MSHQPLVGGGETLVAVVIHVPLFSASFTGSIGPDWPCHGMRSGGISVILVHKMSGEGGFWCLIFSPGRDLVINTITGVAVFSVGGVSAVFWIAAFFFFFFFFLFFTTGGYTPIRPFQKTRVSPQYRGRFQLFK